MTASPLSPAAPPAPAPAARRDGLVYAAAMVAPRLPAFLLLPFLARVLSLRDMGLLATAWVFIELFQTCAGLGLKSSLARHFPLATDRARRREVLSTALAGIAGGGLVLALLTGAAFAWPPSRGSLAFLAAVDAPILAAVLAAAWIGNLVSAFTLCFRADNRPFAFLLAGLLGGLLELGLCATLIASGRATLLNLLLAEVAKQVAMLALVAFHLRRDWGWAARAPALRSLLAFGIWMVPVGLGEWVVTASDRFWLGQGGDIAQVGVYGFFGRFAIPMGILWTGTLMSLHARLYRLPEGEGLGFARWGLDRHLGRGGVLMLAYGALLPAALLAGSRLHPLVPADYLRGAPIFPLLVANVFVFNWARHHALWLEYRFRTRDLGFAQGIAAAASLLLVPGGIAAGRALGGHLLAGAACGSLAAQLVSAYALARMAGLPGGRRDWAAGLAWVAASAAASGALAIAAGLTPTVR